MFKKIFKKIIYCTKKLNFLSKEVNLLPKTMYLSYEKIHIIIVK